MKVKVVKKVSIILLFIGILTATFFVTKSHYFERGFSGGRGVQAFEQVALNHMYKRLFDDERYVDLSEQLELNMWLAIPALYEFTKNTDASEDDREAGARVLARAVKYFYMNPRIVKAPESLDLNKGTQKILFAEVKQEDIEDSLKITLQNIAPLLEEQLDGLSGYLNDIVLQMYFDELKVQAVFNDLVEQRFFPGQERNANGITVMTPRGTGSWGSVGGKPGGFRMEYQRPKLKVHFDGSNLVVNGESYGELNKNEVVDFRVPGHVFVNDQERNPK